jgi:hypothetical protein
MKTYEVTYDGCVIGQVSSATEAGAFWLARHDNPHICSIDLFLREIK